jgi:hypothetical protein
MQLKYPLLPCMISGGMKKKAATGKSGKAEWIPVELCKIIPEIGEEPCTQDLLVVLSF